jgi:hypothetical protein
MPRKLVVEYECDRCGRKWYVGHTEGEEPPEQCHLELKFTVPGASLPVRDVVFDVLCISCAKTISNLVEGLDKLEKKSPKPRAKESAPEGAGAAVEATPPSPRTSSAGKPATKTQAKRR